MPNNMEKVVKCDYCYKYFGYSETNTKCPFCHVEYIKIIEVEAKEVSKKKENSKTSRQSFKTWLNN